jgi:hypothetical protein
LKEVDTKEKSVAILEVEEPVTVTPQKNKKTGAKLNGNMFVGPM